MGGRIREQPDAMNGKVREDLPSEADLPECSLTAIVRALSIPDPCLAMKHYPCGCYVAVDPETFAAVVQVNQGTSTRFGDGSEGTFDYVAAVAQRGAEHVTSKTVRMHADWNDVSRNRHVSED